MRGGQYHIFCIWASRLEAKGEAIELYKFKETLQKFLGQEIFFELNAYTMTPNYTFLNSKKYNL